MHYAADDGLPALVDGDMLHRDFLLSSGPVTLERLKLRREGSRELVESALRAVLLRDIFHMSKTAREGHSRHMHDGHLRGEHGLHLVPRFHALDHGKHEVQRALVYFGA